MDVDREVLAYPGITADAMLAEPSHQVVRKAMAEVTSMPLVALAQGEVPATALLAVNPSAEAALDALNQALWDAYADRLEDFASLREELHE